MVLGGTNKRLWRKICKNEYHCCVVIETYDNVKHFVQRVVKDGSEENSIIASVFKKIDALVSIEKFTKKYIIN